MTRLDGLNERHSALSSRDRAGGRAWLEEKPVGMGTERAEATSLMLDFAERTGLISDAAPRRYLWTDAFAVCNFLGLWRGTGDDRYRALAIALIEQVHGVLGRHRPDDARTGWLSGLPEDEGARHPTRGGLRIGKPLPERRPGEPFDERLEWERDGQYFHYLTKWMDALATAATVLGAPDCRRQAVGLAEAVFPRFLQRSLSGDPVGLAWKMSIDLSRPQVSGTSPHDALDGYVTFRRLATGSPVPDGNLGEAIGILRELSAGGAWATSDPLGIGGLLLDAFRLAGLPDRAPSDERLLRDILAGADRGLQRFSREGSLRLPASHRLAFRELGLAIGLQTLRATSAATGRSPDFDRVIDSLLANAGIGDEIVESWTDPQSRRSRTWRDHHDINDVMLATALIQAQDGPAWPGSGPSDS